MNDYLDMAGIEYEAHGTHVAGTMLANRDGVGTHGVAYGAALNTVRIFSNTYNFLPPVYKKTQSIEPGHFDTSTPTYKQM
ncbi:S8 family serine peptidase, partial [Pseudomonas sp. FSL R10-0071]|uniref:S8 family serine peptidase n=1 Tax=Pseudomonas sp. FSL R10-0071 TaxID=2662193 RepID=UPI002113D44D